MKIEKDVQNSVIYDYFNSKLKVFEIAKKHNLCRQSIRHIILENKLKLKDKKISDIIEKNIIQDYLNNITNKELSKKYNLHRCVIQQIIKRNNIKLKPLSETSRKHIFKDENFFESINKEENAYFLGLLYADGYINNNGFGISLIETDKYLLEKLSLLLYNKNTIRYRKSKKYSKDSKYISKPQYRLEVVSLKMKNDLIKYGCLPNKTFKIRLPLLDNDYLYKCFIRGYFDGDGCISIPTKHPNNIVVSFTSNNDFCDDMVKYIKTQLNINIKSHIRYNNIGGIRLTGSNQVIIFMNWLYKDSTIFMKRKYEKFIKYIQYKRLKKINI